MALPTEYRLTIVSCCHGRVRAASACPAQRSITGRLWTWTASAAPTSAPPSMISASAWRSRPNAGSHEPCTSTPEPMAVGHQYSGGFGYDRARERGAADHRVRSRRGRAVDLGLDAVL